MHTTNSARFSGNRYQVAVETVSAQHSWHVCCPTQLACVLHTWLVCCPTTLLPNNTLASCKATLLPSCNQFKKGKTGGDDGKQRCQVESNSRRRRRVTEIGALPGNNAMEDCVFVSDGPIHARVQNLSGLS